MRGLLDGTVRGTARASRGTFTKKDYERRADYYEQDYLFASASEEDKAFARRLREFAANLGGTARGHLAERLASTPAACSTALRQAPWSSSASPWPIAML